MVKAPAWMCVVDDHFQSAPSTLTEQVAQLSRVRDRYEAMLGGLRWITAMQLKNPIYTIGHSTLSLETFLDLLSGHGVQCLADIRRFPGSRKYPHFNREALEASLHDAGIDYVWLERLGGRRGRQKSQDSPNTALRNESFRNYADYMATDDFRSGIDELLDVAGARVTAYMCSEAVYWRCHRRLVSDYLLANGILAQHLMSAGKPRPHALTPGAVMSDGTVTYPGEAQP